MPIKRVLSDKEIADIKSMKNKTTINDIADKYKIGYHRIYKIFNEPDEEPIIEEPIVDDPVIDDPVITAIKQLGEQLAEIKVAVCYLVDNKLDKLLDSELVKAVGQHSRDINEIVDILQIILDKYLTQDDIDEINYLRGKMPVSSIADHFKISLNRIYKVFSGEERPTEFYTFRDQQQGEALKKLNEEIARSSRNASVSNASKKSKIKKLKKIIQQVSDENKKLKFSFENLKSEIIEAVKPAVESQAIPTQVEVQALPTQASQQLPRWIKNHYEMYPPDEKLIILPGEEEKEFDFLMKEVEEINKFGNKLYKKL
ncbi:hypothetical protein CHS0354_014460 [Potamilus streckersoni]|uniref:Uncharacterized protein n=1 Tax=Potamilus streckersoni TaxID=2493646 RepID=A0AAE0S9N9_9BIVA|nr:hypothetical protein CHS0354_014460 [Potamilus streckersoni]